MRTVKPDREKRFRELYADAYEDVLRFAQRRVHPSYAEDVAADAFLVAWRRFDEAPTSLGDRRAWLFGIARNCLLNTRRGQGRRDALAVRISEIPLATSTDTEAVGQLIDLAAGWRRLSPTDQETLALTVFENLTSPEAAKVLGITSASYRVRLMRARRALRRHLMHSPSYPLMDIQLEAQS